jgi:hypothetical protein
VSKQIHSYYIHITRSNLSGSVKGPCCSTQNNPGHASWYKIEGQRTPEPQETSSIWKRNKCTGFSEEDQHYHSKSNSSCTKQFSNSSGLTAFSYGDSQNNPRLTDKLSVNLGIHRQLQDPRRPKNEQSSQKIIKVECKMLKKIIKPY